MRNIVHARDMGGRATCSAAWFTIALVLVTLAVPLPAVTATVLYDDTDTLLHTLETMSLEFAHLIDYTVLKDAHLPTFMPVLTITNMSTGKHTRARLLIVAGEHGRELITTNVALAFARVGVHSWCLAGGSGTHAHNHVTFHIHRPLLVPTHPVLHTFCNIPSFTLSLWPTWPGACWLTGDACVSANRWPVLTSTATGGMNGLKARCADCVH